MTRGVRNSGPNASIRFVERGGNVTGWERRLAEGLSPEPPEPRAHDSKHHFGAEVLGDARSTVVLASRLDCRGEEKAAKRILTGFGRTGAGRWVVRGSSTMTASRGADLARRASPGRQADSNVDGSGLFLQRRRGVVVFAWTRGLQKPPSRADERFPWREVVSVRRRCFEGKPKEHPSRVMSLAIQRVMGRQPKKDLRVSPARVSTPPNLHGHSGARASGVSGSSRNALPPRSAAKRRLGSATSIAGSP